MPTFLPSAASAAARFAVSVDLPTPPLPEPMQMTLLTCARAPVGSAPPRPSFFCRLAFSLSLRTSKATLTFGTPRSWTALATAVWKWLRIGQPAVVSDTVTATLPSSAMSIARTMPSSTMFSRSSGSMTTVSAWRISSREGMAMCTIVANGDPRLSDDGPPNGRPVGGRRILRSRLGDRGDALLDGGRGLLAGGEARLEQVLGARGDEVGGRGDRLDLLGDVGAQAHDVL